MKLLQLFFLGTTLLLTSCLTSNNDDQATGGEDFPNSIGQTMASNINDFDGWNKLNNTR